MNAIVPSEIQQLINICGLGENDYNLDKIMSISEQVTALNEVSEKLNGFETKAQDNTQLITNYETQVIDLMINRPYKIKMINILQEDGEVTPASQSANLLIETLPLINKDYSYGSATCMNADDFVTLISLNACPPGVKG